MVGPGAGLAPFKGFIEEKVFAQQEGLIEKKSLIG